MFRSYKNVLIRFHVSGHFIAGLLVSGDLFLWHKDSDTIKHIRGLNVFRASLTHSEPVKNDTSAPEPPPGKHLLIFPYCHVVLWVLIVFPASERVRPLLNVSDDGSRILLILNFTEVYVWQLQSGASFFVSKQHTHLPGDWQAVAASRDVTLPGVEYRETSIDAAWFVNGNAFGVNCACSLAFSEKTNLVLTTLLVRWFDPATVQTRTQPSFIADWSSKAFPLTDIATHAQPLHSRGAYVTRVSHDGNMAAVAGNQKNSHHNRVAFISPSTGMVLVSDLLGCGTSQPTTDNYRYALTSFNMASYCLPDVASLQVVLGE